MAPTAPNLPTTPIPRRALGRTGQSVTIFSLGGEGVLRTHGREAEAVAVIQRALQQGVNYFETAPAYFPSRKLSKYCRACSLCFFGRRWPLKGSVLPCSISVAAF